MAYSFSLFGLTLYSYPLMTFLGILAFLIYAYFILRHVEYETDTVIFKSVIIAVPSLIVLVGVAFLLNSLFHSIEEGRLVLGGITWAGGVLGAFVSFPLFTRLFMKEKEGEELRFFSHLVPGIALAHALGRVGCFLAGCCYGSITSSPLGVVYPPGSLPALTYTDYTDPSYPCSMPLLPTQLFEAAFELLLFLLMVLLYRRAKDYNTAIYLIAYGAFRFGLEFLRGDDRGATGLALSPSQLMSLLFLLAGLLLLLLEWRRSRKEERRYLRRITGGRP